MLPRPTRSRRSDTLFPYTTLCRSTFGVGGRALVHLCCGGDPARLNAMRVRLTSPVFPGDVIRTEVWEEGNVLRFRSSVPARGEVVVDCGTADRMSTRLNSSH